MRSSADDHACVELLQWALPRLRLRWPGFRKVRGQVCKRIRRRMQALGVDTVHDYRTYLEEHSDEWQTLDGLCQISISRFFRDRGVFECLHAQVLPALADAVMARGGSRLQLWSAGCGSGEEPYSLAILWQLGLQTRYPGLRPRILATDASPEMIRRAQAASYRASSLKELPPSWRRIAFAETDSAYRLRARFRQAVDFRREDVRERMPEGRFDLVLCRNLAFTYFEETLQRETLSGLLGHLREGGALVIGSHERLPGDIPALRSWSAPCRIYRKVAAGSDPCPRAARAPLQPGSGTTPRC